jgi:hypothetical protein
MSVAEWKNKDKLELQKWLSGLLREGTVSVKFEKKDGSLREMKCTLKDVPVYEKKTQTPRKQNDEVMSVFDVDLQEWRSFRLDSLKEIGFTL